MSERVNRDYEHWAMTFEQAWEDPGRVATLACPSCGSHSLRLVYVLDDLAASHGLFAFWCDACLKGFPPNIGPVPARAQRIHRGEEQIPNYDVVIESS